MTGHNPEIVQGIEVTRTGRSGTTEKVWSGVPREFRRRTRYLNTADVDAVLEVDGQIKRIPLNLSTRVGRLLNRSGT